MQTPRFTRREFIQRAAAFAGATLLAPPTLAAAARATKRTAVDQVTLGRTGLKLSRVGMGTGSNGGNVQFKLGRETFDGLVRYAYDQGITYFDCAQNYRTFGWMGGAIRGLPREKLFIQSKIPGKPEAVLKVIDDHRKNFGTDYIDSMLIHCMVKDGWTDEWKRIMDAFDEAKQRGWIRAKGVSCHSLPALRTAVVSDWHEVHLVRVNPQAKYIDGPEQVGNRPGNDLNPVLQEMGKMRAKQRGVIGMKIIGNGNFTDAEDREKSIRFAMSRRELDAIVIGFKSREEIDEAIGRVNRALAGA
jgi:predicted aldo/keto reductase-like oxidoreductase